MSFVLLVVLSLFFGSGRVYSKDLGSYIISDVTVSGLSSGAYMAVQLHISFSSIINGSAIFAGGPFYCAEGSVLYAETLCMDGSGGGPQVTKLVDLTISDEKLHYIDHTANLVDDRVYLYSGKLDTVVDQSVMTALQKYYASFIPTRNIAVKFDLAAEHCIPTIYYADGEACDVLASPYLGRCDYDGAGAAVAALYGPDLYPASNAVSTNLLPFDQRPFIPSALSSIGDTGYIYVPTACQTQSCHLHISLHGCEQTLGQVGPLYAQYTGFNEWAEANRIIVLYPYVQVSKSVPTNPNGCWDWWGYTNPLYGVKQGVQMKFIENLITRVSGK